MMKMFVNDIILYVYFSKEMLFIFSLFDELDLKFINGLIIINELSVISMLV